MPTIPQSSLFEEPEERRELPKKIGAAWVGPSSIRTVLTPGRGSTASYDYTLNAYRGCTFGCAYCYAPSFESRTDLADKWGDWVEVKEQALACLTGVDLRGKSIFMSSVTDPYQPIEAKIQLTRRIVKRLLEDQAHLVVQTRSPIAARDVDLFRQFRHLRVNMSIPTDCDQVRRDYEKSAPSIEARFKTVRRLRDAGVPVSVCISPMAPVKDPVRFAKMINESGANMVTSSWFHESTKAFTANTRVGAFDKNREQRWTREEYLRTRETLSRLCPSWSESKYAFGPVGRQEDPSRK